jgi:glucosamine-6-phosphate deaminase
MEVVIVSSPDEGGALVADAVLTLVRRKPDAVLGLATGSSPLPVYRSLAGRHDEVSLARVRGFALDEYVGLPTGHRASYRQVVAEQVVGPLGLDPGRVRVPDGGADDLAAAAEDYERAIIDAGGVDLQLLGIGTDGHIGFNEPTSSLRSRTRVKTLTAQTRADNARFFDPPDEVPTHCLTQGLATILDARHLVLLAWGSGKAAAVAAAVEGPLSAMCPASVLQLHPHATVVVDEAAAERLALTAYYRETWAAKPAWQPL